MVRRQTLAVSPAATIIKMWSRAVCAENFRKKELRKSTWRLRRIYKIVAELCMALTVASRHCVPKAPVRLHKATPELLTANY